MKHTIKQFLYGLFPLAVGTVCNYCIVCLPVSMILFNLLYLVTWGYLCYRFTIPEQNPFVQTTRICLPGLCMLALVLYQELVLLPISPVCWDWRVSSISCQVCRFSVFSSHPLWIYAVLTTFSLRNTLA